MLEILIIEPYYGGSHRALLDTFVCHTRQRCTLLTLPARKWKWRMRGAALWFAEQLQGDLRPYDLIFASDMLSIADLRAVLPGRLAAKPIVCYFHENQLTYPLEDESQRDYQYGFTNITSCLAADAVWFNSHYHRDAFLSAAQALLRKMPDYMPAGVIDAIGRRSAVRYPLVERPTAPRQRHRGDAPLRILWNHRREYDKNPEDFFAALFDLHDRAVPFELALLGEEFRTAPAVFEEARRRLKDRIVHDGFAPSRNDYWRIVSGCDIVISTAWQENFGLSVVEAILAGCQPLFANRLSYPELIPAEYHEDVLFETRSDLVQRLEGLLRDGVRTDLVDAMLRFAGSSFGVESGISLYDNDLCMICESADPGAG